MMRQFFTFFAFSFFSLAGIAQSTSDQQLKKLETFYRYLDLAYVEDIEHPQLVEDAIKAMLKDLDPHSTYFSAKELKRANEPLQGNFEGVGIQFNILNDTILVVTPISGGPSEKVGILTGDKIVTIDDSTVAGVGFNNQDVVRNLRGKKGTTVTVGIKRKGEDELLDFEITRDKIPIYSVDASYMVDDEIGYIKLNRFAATSMGEIFEAMTVLEDQGMKSLILDLRGNGGGYLNTAIDLADMFLDKDKLVVYTEGRSYPKQETFATKGGAFEKGKLAILIDEGSASASEIVTGAVQDWDRGLVIGRRSFGKGLVQKPFPLPDGSAIRLTVSRYYTPSGRCIQRPYIDGDKEAYGKDLLNRYESGELSDASNINFPDSLRFETLENSRVVYGGGGIMPDIFVPLDTTQGSEYYSKLVRKGTFNQFVLTYMDEHRTTMEKKYASIDEFKKKFSSTESGAVQELIDFATEKGIEPDEEDLNTSSDLINRSLKGLIARNLFESGAYYQIVNDYDNTFNKAVETLKDDTFLHLKLTYK